MGSIRCSALLVAGIGAATFLLAATVPASAGSLAPVGEEVTLQVAEGNILAVPEMAVAADGTLWSIWQDDVTGIGARAFAPDLEAVAPMRPVAANRLPAHAPYRGPALVREGATVVPLADGRLFVVWREQRLDLTVDFFYQRSEVTSNAIAGRLIGPTGQPASRIFTLAERSGEGLGTPAAVAIADRRLAVAWSATGSDGDPTGVFARIVAPNGRPLTESFSLDDAGDGVRPALAKAADGGFLAVWQRSEGGVAVRGFDADGAPAGPASAVAESSGSLPVVARGADGGYLAAWVGPVTEPAVGTLEHQIYGRSLDPQGVPVGPTLALSSGGGKAHSSPAVIAAEDGFLAAWTVWGRNFPQAVRAVSLDALGRTAGESVRLSEGTINFQWSLGIAATPEGRYVVSWEGYDDEGENAINGRVFGSIGALRSACLAALTSGAAGCVR